MKKPSRNLLERDQWVKDNNYNLLLSNSITTKRSSFKFGSLQLLELPETSTINGTLRYDPKSMKGLAVSGSIFEICNYFVLFNNYSSKAK